VKPNKTEENMKSRTSDFIYLPIKGLRLSIEWIYFYYVYINISCIRKLGRFLTYMKLYKQNLWDNM
jgi:hypothetical protein